MLRFPFCQDVMFMQTAALFPVTATNGPVGIECTHVEIMLIEIRETVLGKKSRRHTTTSPAADA